MTSNRGKEIITTLHSCKNIGENAEQHYKNLLKLHHQFQSNFEKQDLIKIFNALGNPDRFFIIDLLKQKARCVCELEAALQKSQPAVSRHLKILEELKIIHGWKQGKFTHYSLIQSTYEKYETFLKKWTRNISNWVSHLF
jgi:ArsR family transcriptional regulator, arsenate/arsenite/antimonite-responsive transcriptional repressor